MPAPIEDLFKGGRRARTAGLVDPLRGVNPTWRMECEVTPIYDSMLADGYPSPWLAGDGGSPCTIVPGAVQGG